MDKDFVKAVLLVLETMKTEPSIIESRGNNLVGDYWIMVLGQLQSDGAAAPLTYRDLLVKDSKKIPSLIIRYTTTLHDIEKHERDRQLDNECKKVNIKYVKRAYIISITAIIISTIAAAIALCQLQGWILK